MISCLVVIFSQVRELSSTNQCKFRSKTQTTGAYLEKTLKTNTDFAQKLGALGAEAADVNKFTEAGSNLANTYGQLLPNSSNISASNYISTANSIVSQQAQLGMMFFNPGLGMKGMSLYSDYIMQTMRQNMQFLTDLPQACLSGN